MTFFERLTAASGREVRFRVSIEGIEGSFTQTVTGSASPLMDGRGMLDTIDEHMTRLDIYRLIQTGGGMLISVQDNAAKTLRSAFAPRVRQVSYVTASATANATAINMDTASLAASGTVYIGPETVTYTGVAAGPARITGCTRGAFGSRAIVHRGTADHGIAVSLKPPSWFGRRVTLTGILKGQDGTADVEQILGVYRLEESPQDMGEGKWELRCAHLSDELAKRKLGQGIEEVELNGGLLQPDVVGGVDVFKVVVVDGIGRMFVQSALSTAWKSHAVVQFADAETATRTLAGTDARTIFPIHSVALDSPAVGFDTIYLRRTPLTHRGTGIVNTMNSGLELRMPIKWMKHIVLLQGGRPTVLMQMALISRLGDGANGVFDLLPGIKPNSFGATGFQMGAGVSIVEINASSITAAEAGIGPEWSFPIDDEIPVTDLIESYARATGTAAVYSRDGKLTFRQMRGEKVDIVDTISPAVIVGAINARVEEHHTFPRARVMCNYDPIDARFEKTVSVIDEEMADTYPNAEGTLEISDRSIVVAPVDEGGDNGSLLRPSIPVGQLLPMLRRTMIGNRGGALILTMRVDARMLSLQLGDLINVNLPDVGDFRGGTLEIARGRIIARKPHWQGTHALQSDIEVLIEERLLHFAPVFHIGAIVVEGGDSSLLTIAAPDYAGSSENPGEAPARAEALRRFDRMRAYRPSTGLVIGSPYEVAETVSATQIRIFDSENLIAVGDVLIVGATSIGASPGASDDGFRIEDYPYGDGSVDLQGRWR